MNAVNFERFTALSRDRLGELQATKTAGGFAIDRVALGNDIQSEKEVVNGLTERNSIGSAGSCVWRVAPATPLPSSTSCCRRRESPIRITFQTKPLPARPLQTARKVARVVG
jgi:hypothetical protein